MDKWTSIPIGIFLAWALGGVDELVKILVFFVILDYATGLTAAWINKVANSRQGLRGIAKKLFILSLVSVADKIDFLLHGNDFVRTAALYMIIANEGLSILENGKKMGVRKIPKVFYSGLKMVQSKGEQDFKEKEAKD